jgi:hypothetical protein
VFAPQAATDQDGGLSFDRFLQLPPGEYSLRAFFDGDQTLSAVAAQDRLTIASPSPVTVTLAVGTAGDGSGSVVSSSSGIRCGNECSADYLVGTVVALTAQPDPDSEFVAWDGDCRGSASCTIAMDNPKSATATFASRQARTFALTVNKDGPEVGVVISRLPSIFCGGHCSDRHPAGTVVELLASPEDPAAEFAGWSGDCSGQGVCQVTLAGNRTVTATFRTASSPPN